jgi:hypothetical protein
MTRMYPKSPVNSISHIFLCAYLCLFALSANAAHPLGDLAPRGDPDGQLNAGDLVVMQRLASNTC